MRRSGVRFPSAPPNPPGSRTKLSRRASLLGQDRFPMAGRRIIAAGFLQAGDRRLRPGNAVRRFLGRQIRRRDRARFLPRERTFEMQRPRTVAPSAPETRADINGCVRLVQTSRPRSGRLGVGTDQFEKMRLHVVVGNLVDLLGQLDGAGTQGRFRFAHRAATQAFEEEGDRLV
jgi:hypothetical protein